MPWNNDGNGGGPKNPWGNGPGNQNQWGGGPQGPQPDLDEVLRKMRQSMKTMFPNFGGQGAFSLIILAVAGLWLASGFYRVLPGENAVIQRFGAWERTQTEEGLGYHLPWPIETVTKANVTEIRRITIGFREAAYGPGRGQKTDNQDESQMLTSDANIVDLDLVILWDIKVAEDFVFNIKSPEQTIQKVAESAIREVVGQTPMQPIITKGRDAVARRAQTIMQEILDQYKSGVTIKQVLIQAATVHPDVIPAFEDVVAATQDAERFQNEATIYRNDIIPNARGQAIKMRQEAEGYKQSQIAKATGDADRFNAIYQAYQGGKDVTKTRLYLEMMEDVLKNADKIIIDQEKSSQGVLPYLPLDGMKSQAGKK